MLLWSAAVVPSGTIALFEILVTVAHNLLVYD